MPGETGDLVQQYREYLDRFESAADGPTDFGSFDPFTFFYYHWVITRGSSGSFGWEPVHGSSS